MVNYDDPLGEDDLGEKYDRLWIAAQQEVFLGSTPDERRSSRPTGLVVLVQEDYGTIAAPVQQLGQWLTQQGILAMTAFAAVVVLLWYTVVRLMGDPNDRMRRARKVVGAADPMEELGDTVELPAALKKVIVAFRPLVTASGRGPVPMAKGSACCI